MSLSLSQSVIAQLCLTLCDTLDCSPPGSSVHGILQTKTLEWVTMPPPGDLPNPGIKPRSPALQVDSLPIEPPGKPKIQFRYVNSWCVCLVAQLCLTLCDTLDCSLPGYSVHGIFQARILEWVAISFSREASRPRDRACISCVSSIAGRFFTC